MIKKIITFCILVTSFMACNSPNQKASSAAVEEKRNVKLIYTDWSESVAISYLVKNVLEQNLDYTVEIKLADIDQVYKEVASGEYELYLDAWLPTTHASYFNMYSDSLVQVDTIFANAKVGLVVPSYATISQVSEVPTYADKIVGIDSASGVVQNTRKAMQVYKFSTTIVPGKEAEMVAYMDDAFKRRKPFVITGWQPHEMFSKYDLKFLEDPKQVYGSSEGIFSVAHKAKIENDAVLKRFLERFQLTERQMSSLIKEVLSNPSGENEGAQNWMRKNRLIVSDWTKNLKEFQEKSL